MFGVAFVLRVGLINRVVDAEDLEADTVAYAEALAANAPLSIRASKYSINHSGLERAQRYDARMEGRRCSEKSWTATISRKRRARSWKSANPRFTRGDGGGMLRRTRSQDDAATREHYP